MTIESNTRVCPGTVTDVAQRLSLWAKRDGNGLALVEYSSNVVREEVLRRLHLSVSSQNLLIFEISLPTYQDPTALSDHLLNNLENLAADIVSISGFFDAFKESVPVEDSLRIINLNRERLASLHLKQIWWMDERFLDKASFAMPDLLSWFIPRLRLTEKSKGLEVIGNFSTVNQSKVGQESHFQTAVSGSKAKTHTSKIRLSPINVPGIHSVNFTGRDIALERLHHQLLQSDVGTITAIQGVGGIGKTELARQYAKRYQDYYLGGVCWLQARGVDLAPKIIEFAQTYLGIELTTGRKLKDQLADCWEKWPGKENVLLICDDVTNYEQILAISPPEEDRFHILITTQQYLNKDIKPFIISGLKEKEALLLLRKVIGETDSQSQGQWSGDELVAAKEICAWVGYLPLGLELLGNYLKQNPKVSFLELKQRLESQRIDSNELRKASAGITIGVIEAFNLTWEMLSRNENIETIACWLSLFALAPIPWNLAEKYLDPKKHTKTDKDDWERGRDKLVNLSLLMRLDDQTYQLHPLVREYFLIKLTQRLDADELKRKYCQLMVTVSKTIPSSPTREEFTTITSAIPHVEETATRWKNWLSEKNNDFICPFVAMARFYEAKGLYTQVKPWYEKSLEASKEKFGKTHATIAYSLRNLAKVNVAQGHYESAEKLFLQALEMNRLLFGEENAEVASNLNNLAGLYTNQGHYEKAEQLHVMALELRRKLFGREHPDIAKSVSSLAALYASQGHYEKAEQLHRQALDLRLKLFGEEHPDVAQSINNLAFLYYVRGQYEKAEPLYIQALEMRQKLLGKQHPTVAYSLNNLATLYCARGQYSVAEKLFKSALKTSRLLFGEHHPVVASSLSNLGALYQDQKHFNNAEVLYEQALIINQSIFGEKHPIVAATLNHLAALYENQKKYEKAESFYKQALTINEKALGEEEPTVASCLIALAGLYRKKVLFKQAETYYLKAIDILVRQLGQEHPYTRKALSELWDFVEEVILEKQQEKLSNHPAIQHFVETILSSAADC